MSLRSFRYETIQIIAENCLVLMYQRMRGHKYRPIVCVIMFSNMNMCNDPVQPDEVKCVFARRHCNPGRFNTNLPLTASMSLVSSYELMVIIRKLHNAYKNVFGIPIILSSNN